MEYLYITCIGLLGFFSISLLSKKNKPLSEKIFSFWIVLLLITVVSFLLYVKSISREYPILISLICDSHLLHGAILYLYLKAFTENSFSLQRIHLWHLAPMMFMVIFKLLLNFVFGEMECYKQGGCNEEENVYVIFTYIYKYLVLGIYIFASWRVGLNYKKSTSSPRDKMRSEWVRQILIGVSALFIGVLILQVGRYVLPDLFWEKVLLGNILTTLFIFIFLYIGNSYTYLFVVPSKKRFVNLSESYNAGDIKNGEAIKERQTIFDKLENHMIKKEPFTKGHLTINDLADETGLSSQQISQSINNVTGKNFNEYINIYRVEKLKTLLKDPSNKNYKIMSLAHDCGFTSKSTLIRIFKQQTGQTPSEFQNS